ncbi:hypothetical protein G3480_08175 [Thiorhodococcus mannitoliphagus]|uniref:Phospholipase D-like domain-containing protein n=1 Tax=Thiorhodococcus mannitoliphagus TaxID=329406 RepID=A0A6P1DRW3_9GAMM|nr:phospholipase D-like domain-containing protein [Thiorhodococcus mannitoliphagus]NEX20290.1 hypothetical protein [Thiorhodococcus mannitoliphagus]
METTAHFENIPKEIAKRLTAASAHIAIAVTRFTDRDLFDLLCRQAGRGLQVQLAVPNDAHNVGPGRLNVQRLRDSGGHVFLLPAGSDDAPTLDHNFCVIDQATVITGSYPWTQPAQDNPDGLILVITDGTPNGFDSESDLSRTIAADYLDAFQTLLRDHGLGFQGIDPAEIRRRLEIVRNLLLLEDWDTLAAQLDKLQPARLALGLDPLFAALQDQHGDDALIWIDDYLTGSAERAPVKHQQTALLHLALRALDLQINALRDEQAEIERQIHAFSLRASHALGDLTSRYLELQAEKQRRQAATDPALQAEADRAQADYEQYRDANARAHETPPPPPLKAEDLGELKRLYREASQRCHPDKVNAEDQERAGELFIQLQAAYRNNDLATVQAIHARVREGQLFVTQGVPLTDAETLQHAIVVLRHDLDQLMAELQALRRNDTYQTLKALTDWDAYFDEQRLTLEEAVFQLEAELARMGWQDRDTEGQDMAERTRFKAFLQAHPQFLLPGLSGQAPLGFALLKRYPQRWDWQALSANQTLPWSTALLVRLTEHWDWSALSANPSLPWTPELIERFANRWDWDALSDNAALPWSLELIERHANRWHPTVTRHLAALWQRLHRQDILELMDSTPEPLEEDPDDADEFSDDDESPF